MKTSVSIPALLMMLFLIFSCRENKPKSATFLGMPAVLEIPSVTGPLLIDGIPDEELWKASVKLPLKNKEKDFPEDGGETGIAVRGGFLCFSATLPDSGRLVARSTGLNPAWWREDMVRWMFRFWSPSTGTKIVGILTVNPFGAFSLGSVRDIYNINKNEFLSLTPVKWSSEVIASANIGTDSWTAEAAIPMKYVDSVGFFSVERVRVPRVNTPEMSWYWPGENKQINYSLAYDTIITEMPILKPADVKRFNLDDESGRSLSLLAKQIASLPAQAWTEEERKSLGVKRAIERSLEERMTRAALEEKNAFSNVRTLEDWKTFRDIRLGAMMKWIGPLPERTPLRSAVTGRINYGKGYEIENIIFESRPGLVVTANLYLPDKISGRIPAIVIVHSHHAPKIQSELQDMGMTWAASGTAVLVMDQLCAGERIQSQPWSRESYFGRYALGSQLYLGGESLIKWMAWDIMRGIDLLSERKYIDQKRIILMGAVAGGGDPAALTANLDPRIAAVIPFNFGEAGPEEHYTEGPRKYDFETADPGWAFWETTRNLPGSVRGQYFPWFICAAGAPRNYVYSFEIGWPGTVEDEPAWTRYKKVYGLYGAKDNLASVSGFGPFPGPGECNNVITFLRGRIYPVLNNWFDIPVPGKEYHNVLPESALMCLTHSETVKRDLKPASLVCLELVNERLAGSRAKYNRMPENERTASLCNDLEEKLGDIQPGSSSQVSRLWNKKFPGFELEAFSIETEPGILLPFFMLTPEDMQVRRPAVIALAEGGKGKFLTFRPEEIAKLLSEGITICIPDVRGCGEVSATESRGPGAMSLAATELMLGGTMTGSRLKDTRTLLRWLQGRPEIDPENIALWGDSFSEPNLSDFPFFQSPGQQQGPVPQRQAEPLGQFLAILTALYEKDVKAIACNGGLVSFSSLLQDNFCNVPQDVIVPGLLETGDISDFLKSIAPRPVMFSGLVDGLNRGVSAAMTEKEYGNLKNVSLAEKSNDLLITGWLGKQLKKSDN